MSNYTNINTMTAVLFTVDDVGKEAAYMMHS